MNHLARLSGKIAFLFYILLTVVLLIATFYEKNNGTNLVVQKFYGTAWFIACWLVLSVYALFYLLLQGVHHKIPVFCLHISLILILLGACVTHFTSQSGTIHLRKDASTHYFLEEKGREIAMPFNLKLLDFQVEYYPGTGSPADYISHVEVEDLKINTRFEAGISMNKILKYKGFRFYQASFDSDMQGSILSVSRDIYGIPVTYAGYFALFLSMLILLLDKNGRFRKLIRDPLLKKTVLVIVFCITAFSLQSATLSKDSLTIDKEQARKFGKIWMMYDGRIAPLQTFARDFTMKLTGKTEYRYANAEQVLSGWLFFTQKWQSVELLTIEHEELQQVIGKQTASYMDFYRSGQYKLAPYLQEHLGSQQSPLTKEAVKLDEKIQLINMLQSGMLIKIFPYNNHGSIHWVSTGDELPDSIAVNNGLFIRRFFPMYGAALRTGDAEQVSMLLEKLESYQQLQGGSTIPTNLHRTVELIYNQSDIFQWFFMPCLAIGLCALIFFIIQTLQNRKMPEISRAFSVLLICFFIIFTFILVCRTYIGGRIPMSNGFETMLLIAWCAMLVSLCLRKFSPLVIPFGFLISGFALLVARLGMMNPKITPLVPVLSSPLLSIHVSLLMFAYALTGFMVLNSLSSFTILLFTTKENLSIIRVSIDRLRVLSEIFLYPATFFMAAGIFVGAIWANVSWGRYWGWDPKEVWALITFMLMSLVFHTRTLKWFADTFFFHAYMLVIFASVLMTYFGVNYFLGGMHSYAGNAETENGVALIAGSVILLLGWVGWAFRKYTLMNKG